MRAVFGGRPAPRDYSGSKEGDRQIGALNRHLAWYVGDQPIQWDEMTRTPTGWAIAGNGCIAIDSSVMITLLSI